MQFIRSWLKPLAFLAVLTLWSIGMRIWVHHDLAIEQARDAQQQAAQHAEVEAARAEVAAARSDVAAAKSQIAQERTDLDAQQRQIDRDQRKDKAIWASLARAHRIDKVRSHPAALQRGAPRSH